MPLITFSTSLSIEQPAGCLDALTSITADTLGKPASITMARLQDGQHMTFGGDSESAASALFEVEGIELAADMAESLTTQLCEYAESLGIPASRTFVKLASVPRGMWGGNGRVY